MADQMLRMAGRGTDGTAKAIQSDDAGILTVGGGVTKIRKYNRDSSNLGTNNIIAAGEEYTLVANKLMDEKISTWALNFVEFNRQTSNVLSSLQIKVMFSDTLDGYDIGTEGHELTFSKVFDVSLENTIDKALALPMQGFTGSETAGTSVILAGKPYNYVMGKYMRVIIKNNQPSAAFILRNVNIVENGWF